jgi:predicted metalloprotease with PDZ domain
LAGLDIDVTPRELPVVFIGAATEAREGNLVISSIEWDPPAQRAGLGARDEILAIDGIRANSRTMEALLSSRKPGERVRVLFSRRNGIRETEVAVAKKSERSFKITTLANPDDLQAAMLKDWLKDP